MRSSRRPAREMAEAMHDINLGARLALGIGILHRSGIGTVCARRRQAGPRKHPLNIVNRIVSRDL